jgi:IrrE N-terminal-like domain
MSKAQIEAVAAAVAAQTHYKPGSQIEPVVKRLGGTISFLAWKDWLTHDSDTIQVDGPGRFTIRLMGVDGPLRHRFTIAHELGHYVLHSLAGKKPIIAGRRGSNRVEWEANWFAAAFLMPTKEFKAAAKSLGASPLALAGRFMVSIEAAEVRMKTLGICD